MNKYSYLLVRINQYPHKEIKKPKRKKKIRNEHSVYSQWVDTFGSNGRFNLSQEEFEKYIVFF